MLQPFELLTPQFVARLIPLKKIYLVTQSYKRGLDHFADKPKMGILVTDYDDEGLARIHFSAIKGDQFACVLNLTNATHFAKIKELLDERSPYIIYWAIVKGLDALKQIIGLKYKDNLRRYIATKTTWRIGAEESIRPQLQVIFGELFVILKRSNQEIRVKFEDIEKS